MYSIIEPINVLEYDRVIATNFETLEQALTHLEKFSNNPSCKDFWVTKSEHIRPRILNRKEGE